MRDPQEGIFGMIAKIAFAIVAAIFLVMVGVLIERVATGTLNPETFGRFSEAQPSSAHSAKGIKPLPLLR